MLVQSLPYICIPRFPHFSFNDMTNISHQRGKQIVVFYANKLSVRTLSQLCVIAKRHYTAYNVLMYEICEMGKSV